MKINLANPINVDEIKAKLEANFPDYEVSYQTKSIIKVKASATNAAVVNVGNKNIKIFGDFGTIGARLVFVLSLFLLGVLIPLIIYLAVFMSKQNKMRDEVAAYLKQEFNI